VRIKTFIRKRRLPIIDIGYGSKILDKSESFNLTREALKAKQKQLKQQGKGNNPKRACPLTDEEINILYNRNVLGSHTPQFIRKRRLPIIDIGYGSYCTSFTGEQKHKKSISGIYRQGLN
jgi:hypothetical protein